MADYTRPNVFAIHSWVNPDVCRRLEELLRAADPTLAHYSILPERALRGRKSEVVRGIGNRIRLATAVLVVNTPDLHKREMAGLEMEIAVRMDKRIVVVQPHGDFDLPIPAALQGHVYRFAPWRSDVVGRAIRGEYPEDGRTFDVAEVAHRRRLVAILAAGTAAVSFALIIRDVLAFRQLQSDLADRGVELRWSSGDTGTVVGHALAGAAIGGLLGGLTRDGKTIALMAAAGAAVGAAVGVRKVYHAHLVGTGDLRTLVVDPIPA